jgi:uncharacterized glyoxalase superfamily protein PhnB
VKSIEFYEKAFGLTRKFIAPGNEYGELVTGNTTLSFAAVTLAGSNLPDGFLQSKPGGKPFGIEVGFTTDNVEQLFEQAVRAGATAVAKAKTKPWGQVVAYVQDIDGFLIELCTAMEG